MIGRLIAAYRAVHPDLRKPGLLALTVSLSGPSLGLARLVTGGATKVRPGVALERRLVPGPRAGASVPVLIYRPARRRLPGPVVLWVHGGGFVFGTPQADHARCSAFADAVGAVVVSVAYRLAPEAPFPAALDDIDAALHWVRASAGELQVDPKRLILAGASAGAGLVASLAQLARDRADPAPLLQLLIYPMLDDRTALLRDHAGRGWFGWTPRSNRFAWSSYLGRAPGAVPPPYAAAARAQDLAGLPPAWIGIGEIDLFQPEAAAYAARLEAAGVACELVVVNGAYHGFDTVDADAPVSRRFVEQQHEALRRAVAADDERHRPPGQPS
jgi:acetyl esterase/lipase